MAISLENYNGSELFTMLSRGKILLAEFFREVLVR